MMNFGKLLVPVGVLAAAMTLGASPALAEIYTFDDLPAGNFKTPFQTEPGSNIQFSNFYYLNSADFTEEYGYSGYTLGLGNVGYNGFGNPSTITGASPFTFNGAYLNTAWNTVLEVFVTGSREGLPDLTRTLRLNSIIPTYYTFDWTGLSQVAFTVGRKVDAGYALDGNQIVFDDIGINEAASPAVPEPGTWALLIAGAGVIGGALRRRAGAGVARPA